MLTNSKTSPRIVPRTEATITTVLSGWSPGGTTGRAGSLDDASTHLVVGSDEVHVLGVDGVVEVPNEVVAFLVGKEVDTVEVSFNA